jgi:mRNA-degrading endonuclease RelE of RelBE toxin-antitoxin system
MSDFKSIEQQAILIYDNLYKIRLANSNKNKGKSSGYRIYYYVKHEETIYLLTIYDKSEVTMIDESLLIEIINNELA